MAIAVSYATLLALLAFSCLQFGQLPAAPTFTCREDERKALLQFKAGLRDHTGRLSSWVGQDCCSWWGVVCSNQTGHVIQLRIPSPHHRMIEGDEINPCLLALPQLTYLDLSGNNFSGAQIPKLIGSFERLQHLDLSTAQMVGKVPPELGNLSSLRYLDLSSNYHDSYGLEVGDDRWLSSLSSLQYLDLSSVKIQNGPSALQSLSMLPLLSELRLSDCDIEFVAHPVNFTCLHVLDLSVNNLNKLPPWLFEIPCLRSLDLSSNNFDGHVPNKLANLTSLEYLDLSNNELLEGDSLFWAVSKLTKIKTLSLFSVNLKGHLPLWLGELNDLKVLDLSYNQLNGRLSASLGRLGRLVELDLSGNSFDGVLSEAHFRNFTNLEELNLRGNQLILDVGPEWNPPPKLTRLGLDDCKVGPAFPAWLKKMENVSSISMSNASISDVLPDWLWNFSLNISQIVLSNNMIKGRISASLRHLNNLAALDLSNNQLEDVFPQLPQKIENLYLSNNLIYGQIPSSICKLKKLEALYLSDNQLSGEIPNCWGSHNILRHIFFRNNDLRGTIPASICSGSKLEALDLHSNSLSGRIPLALQKCTQLEILDLGSNKFNGSIPTWLGEKLTSLEVLILGSNMLAQEIPTELGNLSSLQVIDLSQNMLCGTIPQSFGQIAYFTMKKDYPEEVLLIFNEEVDINMKGRVDGYEAYTFSLPISMDLSSNNLSGAIPEALMALVGLQNLNLSRNHLVGTIPRNITALQHLESLDLSFNNFTGEIPSTMTTLHFLSTMNFSFNDLSGRIPTGGQFDSHPDPSIYTGNANLCGFPLDSTCGGDAADPPSQSDNNKEARENEEIWFYVSATLGFIIGFWALIGTLLLNRKWRIAYNRRIDHKCDNIYVFVSLIHAKIVRSSKQVLF